MFAATQAPSSTASQTAFLPTMAKRTASQASEPVVKEAPVISVEDFDIGLFAAKARGLKKDGERVFATSYNHQKFRVNLTPGKKWLQVKYRIQASDYDKNDNKIKVKLVINEEVASLISSVEEEVKKVVLAEEKNAVWHSALKDDTFAANLVMVSKSADYLTQCKVRPYQKDVVVVSGKEQLEPLLKENSCFMGAKAKVMVSLESVWVMKNDKDAKDAPTAGMTWKINNLMVDLPEQIRYVVPDVFADASWDDEE